VDQIKNFGIVIGSRDAVGAYYIDGAKIDSKMIDDERGHADASVYPKYFHDHLPDYHMTTVTLGQLERKYADVR